VGEHLDRLRVDAFSFESIDARKWVLTIFLSFLSESGPTLQEGDWSGWSSGDVRKVQKLLTARGLFYLPSASTPDQGAARWKQKVSHLFVQFLDPVAMQLEDAREQLDLEIDRVRLKSRTGRDKIGGKLVFEAWSVEEKKVAYMQRLKRNGGKQLDLDGIAVKATFKFVDRGELFKETALDRIVVSTFSTDHGCELLFDRETLTPLGSATPIVYRDVKGAWPGLEKAQNCGLPLPTFFTSRLPT
jgi:hypothetical protein